MEDLPQILIAEGMKLANCGNEKVDINVFNELKHDILPIFLSSDGDKNFRFISFILINFLDDLSYNLTVDFPYKEPYGPKVHEKKIDFFKFVGESLVQMGNSLQANDLTEVIGHYSNVVIRYLNLADEINSIIEGSS